MVDKILIKRRSILLERTQVGVLREAVDDAGHLMALEVGQNALVAPLLLDRPDHMESPGHASVRQKRQHRLQGVDGKKFGICTFIRPGKNLIENRAILPIGVNTRAWRIDHGGHLQSQLESQIRTQGHQNPDSADRRPPEDHAHNR